MEEATTTTSVAITLTLRLLVALTLLPLAVHPYLCPSSKFYSYSCSYSYFCSSSRAQTQLQAPCGLLVLTSLKYRYCIWAEPNLLLLFPFVRPLSIFWLVLLIFALERVEAAMRRRGHWNAALVSVPRLSFPATHEVLTKGKVQSAVAQSSIGHSTSETDPGAQGGGFLGIPRGLVAGEIHGSYSFPRKRTSKHENLSAKNPVQDATPRLICKARMVPEPLGSEMLTV